MSLPLEFRGLIDKTFDEILGQISNPGWLSGMMEIFHLKVDEIPLFLKGYVTGTVTSTFLALYHRTLTQEELNEILGVVMKRSNEIYDKVAEYRDNL